MESTMEQFASMPLDKMVIIINEYIEKYPRMFPPSWILRAILRERGDDSYITLSHSSTVSAKAVYSRCDTRMPIGMAARIS